MKKNLRKSGSRKYLVFGLAFLLAISLAGTASAVEKTGQDSLKDADALKEELDAYLAQLVETLDSSGAELSEINRMIDETDRNIEENSLLLEQTQKDSKAQEQSMKKRMRYLYESSGDMNVIEALLTADSIGDAINRTSYISKIVDYDRLMLSRYITTIDTINALQTDLKDSREKLVELKDNLGQVGAELSAVVAEVPDRMEELGVAKEDIEEVIKDYREEHPKEEVGEEEPETTGSPDKPDPENRTEEPETPAPETLKETETKTEPETTSVQPVTTVKEPETEPVETTSQEPETETETEPEQETTDGGGAYGAPNDDPVWNLARITYLENGVMYPESSYRSIYLTACVVINRANAWYGGSIMDSIYASGAYATAYKYDSWTGGELVINDITWQAVNEALANPDPNPFYQCNGSWLEGMGLKEYYRDPVTNEVFYYLN